MFMVWVITALFLLEIRESPRICLTMEFGAATMDRSELGLRIYSRMKYKVLHKRQRLALMILCNFTFALSSLSCSLTWPSHSSIANEPLTDYNLVEYLPSIFICFMKTNVLFKTPLHHFLWSFNTTSFSFPHSHTPRQNWHLLFSASTLFLWKTLGAF